MTTERQDILVELHALIAAITDTNTQDMDVANGFATGMLRAYWRCAMISSATHDQMSQSALRAWREARGTKGA